MNHDTTRAQLAKAAGERAPKTQPMHWTQRQARYLRQLAGPGRNTANIKLTPRQQRRVNKRRHRALLAQTAPVQP